MLEQTSGRIKIYQENALQTVKVLMFEVEFDSHEPGKDVYQISKNREDGIFLELDIYYPSERHIEYLERDNARLQNLVDEMRDTIDNLEDGENWEDDEQCE